MRTPPQERGWELAEKLESRKSFLHSSHYMRSAQSCGPLYAWVCDFWGELHHTTSPKAPICPGNCQA
jgi:hypothetical protein